MRNEESCYYLVVVELFCLINVVSYHYVASYSDKTKFVIFFLVIYLF